MYIEHTGHGLEQDSKENKLTSPSADTDGKEEVVPDSDVVEATSSDETEEETAVVTPTRNEKRRKRKKRNKGPGRKGGQKRQLMRGVSTQSAGPSVHPIVPSVVPETTMKPRHYIVMLSFILFVLAPFGVVYWYLDTHAADQYASTVGFTVRKEESASPTDFLGGLVGISSGSSSDTDILYEFIQSQQLIKSMDVKLDLVEMFSKPENDPVFAFDSSKPLESLVDYWGRMVKVYYDSATGLIEVRVLAFTPEDAQTIAAEIFEQSTAMINQLSDIAREDVTRYAKAELEAAVDKLKAARQAVTEFRNLNMIVDPSADIQGQMGLLNTLQQQLADALIELDLLRDITRENDPRIEQAVRKTEVIENRINEERQKFGLGDDSGEEAYAVLLGKYEILTVDREFAERTYFTALAAYDSAVSEAGRQTRYLAAYVEPTFAESAQYPKRMTLFGLTGLFLVLIWSISVLVVYSIRDRR